MPLPALRTTSPAFPFWELPEMSFVDPEDNSALPVSSKIFPDSCVPSKETIVEIATEPLARPLPLTISTLPPLATALLPL